MLSSLQELPSFHVYEDEDSIKTSVTGTIILMNDNNPLLHISDEEQVILTETVSTLKLFPCNCRLKQ